MNTLTVMLILGASMLTKSVDANCTPTQKQEADGTCTQCPIYSRVQTRDGIPKLYCFADICPDANSPNKTYVNTIVGQRLKQAHCTIH